MSLSQVFLELVGTNQNLNEVYVLFLVTSFKGSFMLGPFFFYLQFTAFFEKLGKCIIFELFELSSDWFIYFKKKKKNKPVG